MILIDCNVLFQGYHFNKMLFIRYFLYFHFIISHRIRTLILHLYTLYFHHTAFWSHHSGHSCLSSLWGSIYLTYGLIFISFKLYFIFWFFRLFSAVEGKSLYFSKLFINRFSHFRHLISHVFFHLSSLLKQFTSKELYFSLFYH